MAFQVSTLLNGLLKASAEVTAIVATRIYPILAPSRSTSAGATWEPYLTYQTTDGDQDYHMQGESMSLAVVQVDCWATTYKNASMLADAVKKTLSGAQGSSSIDYTIFVKPGFETYEPDTKLYRASLEANVHYT